MIIFFLFLFVLQLIHEENVTGVVSMNEDYELWFFANGKKVSLLLGTLQFCFVGVTGFLSKGGYTLVTLPRTITP
jgi:hypothetical protein